jgi:hypothetical protein
MIGEFDPDDLLTKARLALGWTQEDIAGTPKEAFVPSPAVAQALQPQPDPNQMAQMQQAQQTQQGGAVDPAAQAQMAQMQQAQGGQAPPADPAAAANAPGPMTADAVRAIIREELDRGGAGGGGGGGGGGGAKGQKASQQEEHTQIIRNMAVDMHRMKKIMHGIAEATGVKVDDEDPTRDPGTGLPVPQQVQQPAPGGQAQPAAQPAAPKAAFDVNAWYHQDVVGERPASVGEVGTPAPIAHDDDLVDAMKGILFGV